MEFDPTKKYETVSGIPVHVAFEKDGKLHTFLELPDGDACPQMYDKDGFPANVSETATRLWYMPRKEMVTPDEWVRLMTLREKKPRVKLPSNYIYVQENGGLSFVNHAPKTNFATILLEGEIEEGANLVIKI